MVSYLDGGGTSHLISKLLDTMYPVGSIYISVDSTSPASIFGGVWEQYARGRTIVGIDATDTDFNTVGKTGGSKTNILQSNQLPVRLGATVSIAQESTLDYGVRLATIRTPYYDSHYIGLGPITNVGGGKPHSIQNPYIVAYMWRRKA